MKLTAPRTISNIETWEEAKRYIATAIDDLIALVNGSMSLTENCQTTLVSVAVPTANLDVSVDHGLGKVPSGYSLVGSSVALTVYDGATASNATKLYVRSTVAGTIKLLVF